MNMSRMKTTSNYEYQVDITYAQKCILEKISQKREILSFQDCNDDGYYDVGHQEYLDYEDNYADYNDCHGDYYDAE